MKEDKAKTLKKEKEVHKIRMILLNLQSGQEEEVEVDLIKFREDMTSQMLNVMLVIILDIMLVMKELIYLKKVSNEDQKDSHKEVGCTLLMVYKNSTQEVNSSSIDTDDMCGDKFLFIDFDDENTSGIITFEGPLKTNVQGKT